MNFSFFIVLFIGRVFCVRLPNVMPKVNFKRPLYFYIIVLICVCVFLSQLFKSHILYFTICQKQLSPNILFFSLFKYIWEKKNHTFSPKICAELILFTTGSIKSLSASLQLMNGYFCEKAFKCALWRHLLGKAQYCQFLNISIFVCKKKGQRGRYVQFGVLFWITL